LREERERKELCGFESKIGIVYFKGFKGGDG